MKEKLIVEGTKSIVTNLSIVVVFDVLVIAVVGVGVAIVVVFCVVIVYTIHIWKQSISKRGFPYLEFFFPAY